MVDEHLRVEFLEKSKREIEYWRNYANFLEDYTIQLQNRAHTPKKLAHIYIERRPRAPEGRKIAEYFRHLATSSV